MFPLNIFTPPQYNSDVGYMISVCVDEISNLKSQIY